MPHRFHFLHPLYLLALLPLWALAVWLARRRAHDGPWLRHIDAELLARLRLRGGGGLSPWPLIAALWTLSVVALAGPSWQRQITPAYRLPAAWVIALQLSPSMQARDIVPSRIARARFAIDSLLSAAHAARIGLVAFAGDAYTVAPLTDDVATVRNLSRALSPDLMPEHGARLTPALDKAARLLDAWQGHDRQIVVLMDGVTDPARAMMTAERLHQTGIDVNVVGVGTIGGAPAPNGNGGFKRGRNGKIIMTRLHPAVLRRIAAAGGGEFVTVSQLPLLIDELRAAGLGNFGRAQLAPHVHLAHWLNDGIWLLPLILLLGALAARRGWT